jgi:radical SAM protein with 4Fe4S-binding SPASM domain
MTVEQAITPPRAGAGPFYAVWEVTLACDMACSHCGSRAGKARPEELSTAEALDLVAQLAEVNTVELTLIGGEAYLRPDWLELVRAASTHGIAVGITTGGRHFTPEVARQAVDAGLRSVTVSLDGLEAAHDRQRAKGSFQAALGALRAAREAGIGPLGVNTQLNALTVADLDGMLEVLAPLAPLVWRFQLTVAMGRAADRPDRLLQPYDLLEVMPRLADLARRGAELGVTAIAGNNVGYFGPYESLLRPNAPGVLYSGCSAGVFTLGIEADGTIKACPSLPSAAYRGGNIRKTRLRTLIDEAPAVRFNDGRGAASLWGHCKTCYYADVCRGGCTWTAHVLFGKPGNNPYCHHRALELARQGKRERLVQVERAPGQPFDHARFELVEEPLPPAT